MKMRRLVIVKGMETRFLSCPRMLRGMVPWETGPTGSGFANGRGIDKDCQWSNGRGRRILCRLKT